MAPIIPLKEECLISVKWKKLALDDTVRNGVQFIVPLEMMWQGHAVYTLKEGVITVWI